VKTLFIGGGTPSMLSVAQTERLFELLRHWFSSDSLIEYSLEANPGDVTLEKMKVWRDHGVNRVSVGGQSFDRDKLQVLERTHTPESLVTTIQMLRDYFPKVSLDLIFGVPGETLTRWQDDVEAALDLGVSHISTYGLTFEKGSAFWGRLQRGDLRSIDEEIELEMYKYSCDRLVEAGLEHYEVSNFARPNERCLHNETYWSGRRYWAFGPGAAFFLGNTRGVKHRSTTTYIKRLMKGESPVAEQEEITEEQLIRERLVFGLRRMEGVDLESLGLEGHPELSRELQEILDRHLEKGWLERSGTRVKLTRSGLWISDSLWPDFL
jgi:oxygen-independent coproporphyrinogen-3 oxidase